MSMRFVQRSRAGRLGLHVALWALVLGTASLVSGCGGAGPGQEDLRTGDFLSAKVTRYEYSLDLRPANAPARTAHSLLLLDVPPPGGDCHVLKGPAGLTDVKWNNVPATRFETLEDGAVRICGAAIFAGQVRLEADFVVPEQTYDFTQVGFSRKQDRWGNSFSYLLGWVQQCDRLGLCDDAPDQLAHFVFNVRHDAGQVVLCPGRRDTPNTTTTHCELVGAQAPTYSSFGIAANPAWTQSLSLDINGTRLQFFEVPGGRIAATLDQNVLRDYVGWIQGLLGPLPYGTRLRIAGGPTEWLGLEHPANILLREDLPTLRGEYADMTRHTLMHEIVHQWAGNRTTLADAYDFAWKEAIAEYLTYIYELRHWSSDAAQTRAYWDRMARTSYLYPRPLDAPQPYLSFASEVYGTGPMLLFLQLEDMLPGGQDTVIRAIQQFLLSPGARGTEFLRESLESAAALPPGTLGPYFDAWVLGNGEPDWPYFNVTTRVEDGQLTVTAVQLSFSGRAYPVHLKVRVAGATQTQDVSLDYGLAPTSATLSVTVPFPEPVVQVTVDPDSRVVNRRFLGTVREAAPKRWNF